MKIYVITSGEYSSYHICAVATDPERADRLAEFYSTKYEPAEVEEYDTEDVPYPINDRKSYYVRFDKHGNVEIIYEGPMGWRDEKVCLYANSYVGTNVLAKDKKSAIKIAAERRAKFLTEKMGL